MITIKLNKESYIGLESPLEHNPEGSVTESQKPDSILIVYTNIFANNLAKCAHAWAEHKLVISPKFLNLKPIAHCQRSRVSFNSTSHYEILLQLLIIGPKFPNSFSSTNSWSEKPNVKVSGETNDTFFGVHRGENHRQALLDLKGLLNNVSRTSIVLFNVGREESTASSSDHWQNEIVGTSSDFVAIGVENWRG